MTRHNFKIQNDFNFDFFFFFVFLPPIVWCNAGRCCRCCRRRRLCSGGSRPIGRGRSSNSSSCVISSRWVHVAPFSGQGAVGQHGQPENQQRQHKQQSLEWPPPLSRRHRPPGLGYHRRRLLTFVVVSFSSFLFFCLFFSVLVLYSMNVRVCV